MEMYRALPPWPDVAETLAELRSRSVRIAFLANFSAAMLDVNVAAARLSEYFEPHLTTDLVHAFKPSPRAYQMGPDAFGLDRREIAFAAFGAWDAAGAKWFGYPTVWVNRADATIEELGTRPDAIVSDFRGVLGFLDAHR
jgi:2-haloacid dehalogenase